MIDLLVNDLLECIKQEIDRNKSDETVSEIRVFTASFPPYVIKQLFERLENHILELDAVSVVCRIGSTLYQHWLSQSDVNPDELIAFETKEWIDGRELTYYRNQKCSPPFKKLVTVLAGVDTALDSAGLADFVVLTEESVWQNSMRKSYINWITKTFIDCGLEMADPLIEDANWFFEDLYKVFPRDLAHLSRFLELVREHSSEFSGGRDFLSFLYSSLNVWGVPPIVQSSRQKCRKLFQQAVKFIQYSDYIDRTNRRKALSKIDNFLLEMGEGTRDFPAPDAVRSNSSIEPEEYLYLARTYIEQNDPIAKATLLTFDCTPLLDLLARRVTVDRSKVVNKLVGPCYQSFLRSICGSLMRACRQVGVPTELLSVDIMVTKFVHEFIEDDENDSSRAALDLLRGLLGGIEEYLNMSIEIPLSDNGLHLIEVETQCDLTEGGIRIITSHVGTPYIEFSVTVNLNGGDQLEDTYRWVCPDVHEERVLYNLGRAIHARMQNHLGISIPAFTLSTYDELFFSSGSEEANRLFLLGLDQLFEVRNVLSENMQQKIRQLPDLSRLLTQLRAHYSGYIQCLIQDGYFQALKSRATSLINAYEDLLVYVISNRSIADSDLGYALCKAFLVTRENVVYSERHLSSAIAFALTPAVIEILQARESYLRAAFPSTVAETLNDDKPSMRQFEHLVSMLEIKRPIVAIVKDRNRSLTTQSRSLGLIQCIGDKPTERLPLASQAVLQEDSADEEITASELFFPNSQAKIFARTLTDYLSVNPHAQDGLSILALDIDDVQSLVAGVDVFLTKLLSTRPSISPPYQFSLKIITRTCTALSIHKWLDNLNIGIAKCRLVTVTSPKLPTTKTLLPMRRTR
jgi:DNA phosphorothioation-dependent restriction protein DptH